MNPAPLIDCKNIDFVVGPTPILQGIQVQVFPGDIIFIAGKSGCGKSTLMKSLAGLQYPSKGDIILRGVSFRAALNHQLLEYHHQNGYLFQDNALISNLTVYDNIALPLRFQGHLSEAAIKERVMGLIHHFELDDDTTNRPAALSMGEAKMCALARAIAHKPNLLFMDEPIASLDRGRVEMMKHEVRELHEAGTTFVIIAHETEFAAEFATRIWHMDKGRLIQDIHAETLGPNKMQALEAII